MLTILQSKVTAKATTSVTWELCSTSWRHTSWRWARPRRSWECRAVNSLDLSSHPKEFTLTLSKSRPFRTCNLWGSSKSSEVYKVGSPTFEYSLQIFWALLAVYMVNEERCLLRMRWSLPKRFRGYQEVLHQASGLGSTHFGKIILALCASYGPFFGRSSGTKEQWRIRIDHLLPE